MADYFTEGVTIVLPSDQSETGWMVVSFDGYLRAYDDEGGIVDGRYSVLSRHETLLAAAEWLRQQPARQERS
jgi:hypothetical protein